MPSQAPAKVRLAAPQQTGATIYNSYQYVTQLAAFYSRGGEAEGLPAVKASWNGASDSAVDDLGVLYLLWDGAAKLQAAGLLNEPTPALAARIVRSCHRADVVLHHANSWTPRTRWLHLALLLEQRWQGLLGGLMQPGSALVDALAPLLSHCQERLGQLKAHYEAQLAEAQRVSACFTLVAQGNAL